MRKVVRQVHLALALVFGLLIVVSGFTGSIFVFWLSRRRVRQAASASRSAA